MSVFSNKLKDAIDQCGVPVQEIAQQSGMSPAMLYKIQRGLRRPDSLATMEQILDAMHCDIAQRRELIRMYKVERVGINMYECMREFKGLLADLTTVPPLHYSWGGVSQIELPPSAIGERNVNAVVRSVLEMEVRNAGGEVKMLVPLQYQYCFECLSQVLPGCSPDFYRVTHLFCLKATAAEDALLYNIRTIRTVLPRMVTMEHYAPKYGYLSDPDNGATMFPYFIITSAGVLLISGSLTDAVFLREPEVRAQYLSAFDRVERYFKSGVEIGDPKIETYFQIFYQMIQKRLNQKITPVVIATAPCVLMCMRREDSLKYLSPELRSNPQILKVSRIFFEMSGQGGCVSFFSLDGMERMLRTGALVEMPGSFVPRASREDVVAATREFIRRAKAGKVIPYVFRTPMLAAGANFSMGLYEDRLLTLFELPNQPAACALISEKTLSRIVQVYAEKAELLGDVYSAKESILLMEQTLDRFCRES